MNSESHGNFCVIFRVVHMCKLLTLVLAKNMHLH